MTRRAIPSRPWALATLLAAALGCAAGSDGIDRTEGAPGLRGRELTPVLPVVPFTLVDTDGNSWDSRTEIAGRLTFLFFGYTNCPDICPVQMAILAAALDDLGYTDREEIQVAFVTTDPDRDSPQVIREWLDRFDRTFIGLRGTIEEVNAIQGQLELPPAVVEPHRPGGDTTQYLVGHATPILAITGDGNVHALYPSGIRQGDWRHDLPRLLSRHRSLTQPS